MTSVRNPPDAARQCVKVLRANPNLTSQGLAHACTYRSEVSNVPSRLRGSEIHIEIAAAISRGAYGAAGVAARSSQTVIGLATPVD